jgi:hypothetical protein
MRLYAYRDEAGVLGLEAIWSIYISVAHWRYRIGRGIYVVDCSEENILSLLQRFILRTYTALKAILPVIQVGNVQR